MKKNKFPVLLMSSLFVFTGIVLTSMGKPEVTIEYEKTTKKTLDISGFDTVQMNSSLWDIDIQHSEDYSVELQYSSHFEEYLDIRVTQGKLIFELKPYKIRKSFSNDKLKAYVTMPSLGSVALNGSGNIDMEGFDENRMEILLRGSGRISAADCRVRQLNMDLSGSGDLNVKEFTADNMEVRAVGSGSVRASNSRVQQLDLGMNGSGSVDFEDLLAVNARVNLVGAGDVLLTMDGGRLEGTLNGSGEIEWYGTVSEESIEKNGAGRVKRGNS